MKINVIMQEENDEFHITPFDSKEHMNVCFGELNFVGGVVDYNDLENKPSINSIVLQGALTAKDLGLASIYYDTTANWAKQMSLISEKGAVYIYSDYSGIIGPSGDIIPIAGIKIGDGSSYLLDIPFITDQLTSIIFRHIANNEMHITAQEREFWNHKVSSYLAGEDDLENLVLSKTNYVTEGDIYHG